MEKTLHEPRTGSYVHLAARNGHSAVAELLLRWRPELITQTNNVSEQIIQSSIFMHDHTWMMMGVDGRVVIIL